MKRKIFLIIIFVLFAVVVGCKNKKITQKDESKLQLISNNIKIISDQWVLAPSKSIYDTAVAKGLDNSVFVFYPRKVISQNGDMILLNEMGDSSLIPACLTIPLPLEQKTVKGDLLITWWQKGTGMQRAIVLSKDSTSTPVVYYIDNQFSSYYSANDLKYSIDTLKVGTFLVVNNNVMPGRSFMVNEDYISNHYIVISSNKDSVVGVSWAGIIKVFPTSVCKFVPKNTSFVSGDSVNVPYLGTYCYGNVKQTWNDIGKMDVVINFLGDSLTTRVNIFDSFKVK